MGLVGGGREGKTRESSRKSGCHQNTIYTCVNIHEKGICFVQKYVLGITILKRGIIIL